MYSGHSLIRAILYVLIALGLIGGTLVAFTLVAFTFNLGLAFFVGAASLAWIKWRSDKDVNVIKWALGKVVQWLRAQITAILDSNGQSSHPHGNPKELQGGGFEVDEETIPPDEDSEKDSDENGVES